MKRNVVSISASATVSEAAGRFVARHIGTLPVVSTSGELVGLLQLRDLLGLVMPDFVRLVEDIDFVHDFGALEGRQPSPEVMAQRVTEVMRPPISVDDRCGLVRAIALMRQSDLHDLPVVNTAHMLVGIASRVDIGVALLAGWRQRGMGGEP
jgi:CBS domain-containing protein